MLGLPFGNDQRANIVKAEVEGYGLALGWDKIDALSLEKALNRLINDPRSFLKLYKHSTVDIE